MKRGSLLRYLGVEQYLHAQTLSLRDENSVIVCPVDVQVWRTVAFFGVWNQVLLR